MTENDVLVKLKALLNMTQANGCTEAEAQNAMEKAQALMLQHNLSRASVDTEANTTPQGIGKIDHTETTGYSWRVMLVNVLARNTLCRVIGSTHDKTWHIFGTYDNVRAVLEMYNWLTIQLEVQGIRDFTSYRKQGGTEHGRTWKAGFFEGAIGAIGKRLRKPMDDFSGGIGHAVVIYNDKAVGDAVKRVYPHLSHSTRYASRSNDGRSYGQSAGNNIRLTPQRMVHSGTLALGAG